MSSSRNLGIDMLRIVAMAMVVMLHVLGQCGILDNVQFSSCNYFVANFFETISYGAVDCFAMISGYVGINSKFRYSNIFTLWRKVAFYTIIIAAVYFILNPQSINIHIIQKSLFPVFSSHYWYFTSYFCLFFFIPFLNKLINSLEKTEMDKCTITILVIFSIIPTVSGHTIFFIDGYSVIWLAICYYIGAYIKKRDLYQLLSKKKFLSCLIFIACIVITYLSVLLNDFISFQTSLPMKDAFLDYTSPTILIYSIIIVSFFANRHPSERVSKIIRIMSPLSFNVYIIHCNVIIWNILANSLSPYANINPILFLLLIISSTLMIYIVCSSIDFIRETIERKLNLKQKIDNTIENKLSSLKNQLKSKML